MSMKMCLNKTAIRVFLMAVFAVVAVQAQTPQKVAVRFLNFKSGKPIKNLNVEITLWNGAATGASAGEMTIMSKVSGGTDGDGKLTIGFPKDFVPEHISIFAADLVEPSGPRLSLRDVLKSGVVVPYRRSKSGSKLPASAQKGEIVILNKKLTAADRMLLELP
jgi:hypothetical protein